MRIIPSLIVFNDGKVCLDQIKQLDTDTAIFFLIDPPFESLMVEHLEKSFRIKHLYYTRKFDDINKLCFRLTHDLIKHYGQLGDQLKTERRNQEAQQMFLRAQQLCKILFN